MWVLSNFVEDVCQGFKVLYNMERNVCGFYKIWKANFVGRITVEVVFYLNYPTLWKSITVEVVLYLNYPTLRKMLAKSAANFAKKSQKFVKIYGVYKSKIAPPVATFRD